jgi:hypothetical protein
MWVGANGNISLIVVGLALSRVKKEKAIGIVFPFVVPSLLIADCFFPYFGRFCEDFLLLVFSFFGRKEYYYLVLLRRLHPYPNCRRLKTIV